MIRPERSEYHEYYRTYVDLVPEGDILDILARQIDETVRLLERVPPARGDFRYAPGKWSIKDVVGHLIDTERVFAYRALTFARGDVGPLPGFEQADFVAMAAASARALADLTDELLLVRRSHVAMLRGFPAEAWTRQGTANNHAITVRALPYLMAGHELHHRRLLLDRYLGSIGPDS